LEQLRATAPVASVTAARIKIFEAALRIIVQFLLGGTTNYLGLRTDTDLRERPSAPTRFEPTQVTNAAARIRWLIQRLAQRAQLSS
jgi:hypothetical protein